MKTIVKRAKQPPLSEDGEYSLARCKHHLSVEEDLAYATIRNHLSDLRHFAAWCESTRRQGQEVEPAFTPEVTNQC